MEVLDCPFCKKHSLTSSSFFEEIPYFGKILILSLKCENCGFKHNDVFNVEMKGPLSYKLRIESEEDLSAKVVRASSGTIIVPEIGVKIEPGMKAYGFITNVEGVLEKIENVLKGQLEIQKGKKLERVKEILKKIEKMKEGKENFTLILKDPFGNSMIVHPKVKKRKLSEKELKKLKTGFVILDLMKK